MDLDPFQTALHLTEVIKPARFGTKAKRFSFICWVKKQQTKQRWFHVFAKVGKPNHSCEPRHLAGQRGPTHWRWSDIITCGTVIQQPRNPVLCNNRLGRDEALAATRSTCGRLAHKSACKHHQRNVFMHFTSTQWVQACMWMPALRLYTAKKNGLWCNLVECVLNHSLGSTFPIGSRSLCCSSVGEQNTTQTLHTHNRNFRKCYANAHVCVNCYIFVTEVLRPLSLALTQSCFWTNKLHP